LIAVAGDFVKDVETDFVNYIYRSADYADLIKEVRSRQPAYIPRGDLSLLATQLGLDDIPLLPDMQVLPAQVAAPAV